MALSISPKASHNHEAARFHRSPEKEKRVSVGPQSATPADFAVGDGSASVNVARPVSPGGYSGVFSDETMDEHEQQSLEDSDTEHCALEPDDEAKIEEHREFIQRCNSTELHVQFKVPLDLKPGDSLGLHINNLPLDGTRPEQAPWPGTKVTWISPIGLLAAWDSLVYNDQPEKILQLDKDDNVNLHIVEVNGLQGSSGVALLQAVLTAHLQGHQSTAKLEITFMKEVLFNFKYKQRHCVGVAVHVLSLCRSEDSLADLKRLLRCQADVAQECTFSSRGTPASAQAIHLAAGRGNVGALRLLLDSNAEIDAKTQLAAGENYTALHEAAFFQQLEAVKFLLKRGAAVNLSNVKGSHPLHVAAKQGNHRISKMLVQAKGDLSAPDLKGATPLVCAVDFGRFPHSKIHILTNRTFDDLLLVASLCPGAASEMMRDKESKIHPSWHQGLMSETNMTLATRKWIRLVGLAPRAAEDILEALTVRPAVENRNHHPLPRRARMAHGIKMKCDYQPASKWEYHGHEKETVPVWHHRLCPGVKDAWENNKHMEHRGMRRGLRWLLFNLRRPPRPPQGPSNANVPIENRDLDPEAFDDLRELTTVKVKQVQLPGLIDPMVLYVLSMVPDHRIFGTLAVQAIVDYCWESVVKWYFFTQIFYKLCVMVVLLIFALNPPSTTLFYKKICWSWLAVIAHAQMVYKLQEARFYLFKMRQASVYFTTWRIWAEFLNHGLLLALVYLSGRNYQMDAFPEVLAATAFTRWVQLTWACRAFEWAGEKILPILHATTTSMTGIFLVTGFAFAAFLHAFLCLEQASDSPDEYGVLMYTLRFLLLADGGGADRVLALGNGNVNQWVVFAFLVLAIIGFCICILNLFIAAHGNAYDHAQDMARTSFLQERASICLQCFIMPAWPPPGVRLRVPSKFTAGLVLVCMAVPAWVLLLWQGFIDPIIPSAVLLYFLLLYDAILVQVPWNKSSGEHHYLWICHRDEPGLEAVENADSRVSKLKQDNAVRQERLKNQMTVLGSNIDRHTVDLKQDVQALNERMRQLEEMLRGMALEIKKVSVLPPPILE